jgi:hypothetical protein
MSASLKQIEEQARGLNAEERAKLAESMLESLHSPLADIEAAWAQEKLAASRGEERTFHRTCSARISRRGRLLQWQGAQAWRSLHRSGRRSYDARRRVSAHGVTCLKEYATRFC